MQSTIHLASVKILDVLVVDYGRPNRRPQIESLRRGDVQQLPIVLRRVSHCLLIVVDDIGDVIASKNGKVGGVRVHYRQTIGRKEDDAKRRSVNGSVLQ